MENTFNEMTLSELYRVLTGNVTVDIETVVEEIKSLEDPDKTNVIGKLLYTIPGGMGQSELVSMFRTKFYEAVDGVVADVDGDGDVDQDDFDAVKAGQDITGDGKVDEKDLNLVKALSTAEIEEIGDDEPIDEEENSTEDAEITE